MAPQRRTKKVNKRDFEKMNYTPSVPTRQTLHRKCKTIKPFYAVDIYDDDEEVYQVEPEPKKKGSILASSKSTKPLKTRLVHKLPIVKLASRTVQNPASTTVDKHPVMELASTTVENPASTMVDKHLIVELASTTVEKPASTAVEEEELPMITEQDPIMELASATVDKHPITIEQGSIVEPASATVNEEQEKPMTKEAFITYSILAWIIETKVVNENTVVRYVHGTNKEVVGGGMISEKGILCLCCLNVFPVSQFRKHRKDDSNTRTYENIFIEKTNVSLLTCQLEAWNRHSVPARSGYNHVVWQPKVHDTCVICAVGGALICCDNCPSTYHPACLGLKDVPKEKWLCSYCHCKYCDEEKPKDILVTCLQCLKKCHSSCSECFDSKQNLPFCGMNCWKVFHTLEGILGEIMPTEKMVDEKEITWTLVRKMDVDLAGQNQEDLYMKVNCNSNLVLASKLMEDSFKHLDRQAQKNMLQSVLYGCGSNYARTNFSYTAILESEGEVISAAILRLPSPEIAEIPYIATSEQWRGKGLRNILLEVIDAALNHMGVEHMVIQSSADMVEYWQSLGFAPLEDAIAEKLTALNTLMLPATVRLRKAVNKLVKMAIKPRIKLDGFINLNLD
uniref:PHD-type domain-containing protein n=1 Tax=Chenopodium quinoa TaxID=63459 RepID=A0A803LUH6_CHEQI